MIEFYFKFIFTHKKDHMLWSVSESKSKILQAEKKIEIFPQRKFYNG